jgi:cell wall assembly regulator SMI1
MAGSWVRFEAGLSESEIAAVEERFHFTFPPDLRALLATTMPQGAEHRGWGFPDWRQLDDTVAAQVAWPVEGVLLNVEKSAYWMAKWGVRPDSIEKAMLVAGAALRAMPKMIPIYSHRYSCELPQLTRNPILSMQQTDIIYFGADLDDYFEEEFFGQRQPRTADRYRGVPFWDDLAGV